MKSVTDQIKSTRDVILHAIKAEAELTVNELAAVASVSPVTVRHHLNALQANGLLEARSVRRKVGRPSYVYSLTEKGLELFPQKYMRLSSLLLDELKERFPADMVADLFRGVVEKIISEHRHEFEHLSFEDRLTYVVGVLADEGFLARWEASADGYTLVEYSCPYLNVGERHREVCTFDTALITAIMGAEFEQHSCMLSGADCCEFSISREAASVAAGGQLIQIEG